MYAFTIALVSINALIDHLSTQLFAIHGIHQRLEYPLLFNFVSSIVAFTTIRSRTNQGMNPFMLVKPWVFQLQL